MFWRSIVVKLWATILLFFTFVLVTLTILLLQFFETYHENEAEEELMQAANVVSKIIGEYHDRELVTNTIEQVRDPSNRVVVFFNDMEYWISDSTDKKLDSVELDWFYSDEDLTEVLSHNGNLKKKTTLPNTDTEVLLVGQPLESQLGAVFIYQSLDNIEETTKQTTRLIVLAAGIAIILTTFFAFFLSTRMTAPLIKMRKAALELAKGEFHTKVPILTHDEIGELAIAFNRMGRQLKYHIHALNQEKEQVQSILASMADGVISLNREGEVVLTNPPADRFIDLLSFNQTSSNREMKIVPNELKEALKQVISREEEVMREISIQGRTFVMLISPLYNQSFIRGAVAVVRDMTEERQLDKLRKDFIANVSHELRTPISMLQGYSEAIMDDIAQSQDEKNELARIIYEESLRMGRLVNELLDLARMEAGHIHLNMEEVNVTPYLTKIYKKFAGIAEEKSIHLLMENNYKSETFIFDPDRMEQVLTNLIDNAIRHTSENGHVKLMVDSLANGSIQFSVVDSGSGIKEEDLPFIFERFYKADKSRVKKEGASGTGLGLAIAKNIIEAHQGTVDVHSKVDKGTTFIVTLPKSIKK
ncbi:ATP-binding protein [Salirhabdus sp. Marseille-P4669]|uniref:ATP-binding protein n=1 Tax=Salirhabdus sp. Marseille-P4669 TaxID=2042310 RepID=UPI000C7D31FF|nr:ATP-binding protein [Salirhabdus sp. Marseille-P4669]